MSRKRNPEPPARPLSPLPAKPQPLTRPWQIGFAFILLAYVALGVGHIYTTPVAPTPEFNYINAPDEAAHIMYVRAVAIGRRIPVRGDEEFPTYEWHQPPVYYWLVSALYGAGPLALRGGSLALGIASLLTLFIGVRLAFPNDPPVAVLAFGFAALLPMRQAITAAVGNDVLTELMFSAVIVCLIAALRHGLNIRRAALLGALIGAAILTKATGLLMIGTTLAGFLMLRRGGVDVSTLLKGAAVTMGVTALLTAGWFARNVRLYHEPTPAKAFLQEFEGTKKAADRIAGDFTRADYLMTVGEMTFQSFWAAYTPHARGAREKTVQDPEALRAQEFFARQGLPSPMPWAYYFPYIGLCGLSFAGLIRYSIRRQSTDSSVQSGTLVISSVTLFLVLAGFVAFIWTFFQTQGRYLYPAMLPISLLFALGCREILPVRYRDVATALILGMLAAQAIGFLFAGVQPAYS